MSITSTGPSLSTGTPLSAPVKASRASSTPLMISGRTPSRAVIPGKEVLDIARISGLPRSRRVSSARARPVRAQPLAEALGRGKGPGQCVGMQLAGGVDPLPESDDLQLADQVSQAAAGSLLGDQQSNGVRAAVDGGDPSKITLFVRAALRHSRSGLKTRVRF